MREITLTLSKSAALVSALILVACVGASAQHRGGVLDEDESRACGFRLLGGLTFTTSEEAQEALNKVIRAAGLIPNRFVIAAADGVGNAMACEDPRSSKRYILYDRTWISGLALGSGATEANWAKIGILAHEVGHHKLGHNMQSDHSTPELELEADEYAGSILAKLGATLEQAQSAFRHPSMCKAQGGRTHPKCSDRLAAVARGWGRVVGGNSSSEFSSALNRIIGDFPNGLRSFRGPRVSGYVEMEGGRLYAALVTLPGFKQCFITESKGISFSCEVDLDLRTGEYLFQQLANGLKSSLSHWSFEGPCYKQVLYLSGPGDQRFFSGVSGHFGFILSLKGLGTRHVTFEIGEGNALKNSSADAMCSLKF